MNVVTPAHPAATGDRALLVFLHGRSGSENTFTDDEAFFTALADLGRRAPVAWNDYGDADPFRVYNEGFVEALGAGSAELTAHSWPGGHETSYWDRHWPAYQPADDGGVPTGGSEWPSHGGSGGDPANRHADQLRDGLRGRATRTLPGTAA